MTRERLPNEWLGIIEKSFPAKDHGYNLKELMLLVSSEYAPMPAAAASRIRPWVDVLEGLGGTVRVLTSKSAEANTPVG